MAIEKKLLEFQKMGITLKKDGLNPHFRSNYVTLNEVLEKVKKPLNDMGILIIQQPDTRGEKYGLETILRDTEDGSDVQSFTPFVGIVDMQKLGGAITYARRYSLIAMLGLEDEDDDGNSAVSTRKPASTKGGKGGVIDQEGEPFTGNDFNI